MNKNQKGFINIIIVIVGVIILAGTAGYFIVSRKTQKPPAPVIEYISPAKAPVGAEISIIGSGFTSTKNSLQFGTGFTYINNLVSSESKTITFTVPESFDTCNPDGSVCAELLSQPTPGQLYEVAVINANGKSNSVNFTVARKEGTPMPTPTPKPTPKPSPAPKPSPTPITEKITRRIGEQESSFLIQKINSNSVDGLWYQAYPVGVEEGAPKTLYIGDDIGYACEGVSEKLTSIDFYGQTITFTKIVSQSPLEVCPICLASNTLIDTPAGSMAVKDLQVGMPIWTTNKAGYRIFGVVTKTSKVPVPPTHQMVHLVLNDGRELFASPGHPTTDGRSVGDLMLGNLYNGASIVGVQRVPYSEDATYDILPSGETGFYWANGVLLGSTLSSK
ncbi:MAG: IPT/TIG domain-containing protein [Candidatus Azambacteria bacterium]|nr:IPT/TIG domain-containing protein [Candidatus Azambacteria bacterium]